MISGDFKSVRRGSPWFVVVRRDSSQLRVKIWIFAPPGVLQCLGSPHSTPKPPPSPKPAWGHVTHIFIILDTKSPNSQLTYDVCTHIVHHILCDIFDFFDILFRPPPSPRL